MNILNKTSRQKKRISLAMLIIVCVVFATGCGSSSKAKGLFDDMEWGTSLTEAAEILQKKEGIEPTANADNTKLQLQVENYLDVEGVTARIDCDFEEELLDEVFIYLEFDENSHSNEEIMERYAEILTKSFGDSSESTSEGSSWKLAESEVQLANFSYGVLVISYTQA